jgi:hypothetical protein
VALHGRVAFATLDDIREIDSGTFRATVLLKDDTGKEVNRCDTGRITWRAGQ